MNTESIELLAPSQQSIALKMRTAEMLGMTLEELLEKEEAVVEDAKTLMTQWQRALIEARDSIPPSFSQQIRDQNKKIDKLSEDMAPVIDAFREDKSFWERVRVYAIRVGWVSAILIGLKLAGVNLLFFWHKI